jgi:uncharacterized protein (TIGR00730 family)
VRICVFCGAYPGRADKYLNAAAAFGEAMVERGVELVYGGAAIGLMGAVADSVLAAGGKVTGVIPRRMVDREIAHHAITDLRVVADMHERKAVMAQLSDAFVALPGGAGTLEELAEVWTWRHIGLHRKPIGLLDVDDYYRPLLDFFDRMVDEEFLRAERRLTLLVEADPKRLLDCVLDEVSERP